jgi:Serine endopeptidase inhibitors
MKQNKKNTPFFAKFLENQQPDVDPEQVIGGATLKYPSDADEIITSRTKDLLQTLKYPSDGDEI